MSFSARTLSSYQTCFVAAVITFLFGCSFSWAQQQQPARFCANGGCGLHKPVKGRIANASVKSSPNSISGGSLNFFRNYFITGDYAVAGVGVRGTGTGTISMTAVPAGADVLAAYLYWETLGNGQNGMFNGNTISGTILGTTSSPCWDVPTITVYRADVLQYLPVNPLYSTQGGPAFLPDTVYSVQFPDSGDFDTAPSTEGASLVIIYRMTGLPFKAVVLYDGAWTINDSTSDFSLTMQGFYQTSSANPQARLTQIVGDGQPQYQDDIFSIDTSNFGDPFGSTSGNVWDNATFDVSDIIGTNASQLTTSTTIVSDCLTWGAVVLSTTVQDTDGDGLLDTWETNGFTDMDGTFINLPAMGANPNKPDIFVQVDWMVAANHSHKPLNLTPIVNAFATAPNPINLHIDLGQGGQFTGGHSINETTPTVWKDGFLSIKNANFAPSALLGVSNRRHIFHYSLWAHDISGLAGVSGISDLPGGDFMVTLGDWPGQTGTQSQQNGTFMHELGHNLHLFHGGNVSLPNYKPDYQSIMNYAYQTVGLQNAAGVLFFDYSRQLLPPLTESSLNDATGLGTTRYRTNYFAPPNLLNTLLNTPPAPSTVNCATPLIQKQSPGTSGGIPWSNNLSEDILGIYSSTPVSVDINGNCVIDPTYTGFADWPVVDLLQVSGRPNYPDNVSLNNSITNPASLDITIQQANASAPPSPVALVARLGTAGVHLLWNPVVLDTVHEYRVYRFQSANPQNTFAYLGHSISVPPNSPAATFTDSTAVSGTSYSYFVTSVSDSGVQSDFSNFVVLTP